MRNGSSPSPAWFTRLGRAPPPTLNLALQGGGAHGAFTWGVLDALLDHPDLAFEGLSGSSAGAMNVVVFAHGWMLGGRDGARQGLADFWTEVGRQMPWHTTTQGEGDATSLSTATRLMANWAGHFSPSQLNPFALNPLRDMLERQIDFERLRSSSPFKLFIAATQANTGKLRIFRESDLTLDKLLASACLPKIHHPVLIDGEPYWDGGYSANPAVFPLFYDCQTSDVLLVLLSPLKHADTPHSVHAIEARIAELSFSAHFMREMNMFARAKAYARNSWLTWGRLERRLQGMRFHMVDSSQLPLLERGETRMLAHGPFLELLKEHGQQRARQWLASHGAAVGQASSIDLVQLFG
ncbi:patatin-like phospholipase family protein [Rhodoferax sp. AJA081-3]|uniref:patatin-like phospholipase family protein n=1 Tax=Rhodoferax sp. AJA081-3 TaxID=2752316 RepID=UPI001AE086FA|nr:patatin-like phospholipase family protein [Rhodoferax sp. AJA081-3]QTN27508.1 patatin-like phospholipase family protein [Rhodoferax sp. AJA081-3]